MQFYYIFKKTLKISLYDRSHGTYLTRDQILSFGFLGYNYNLSRKILNSAHVEHKVFMKSSRENDE
jgi:hypothetical protein